VRGSSNYPAAATCACGHSLRDGGRPRQVNLERSQVSVAARSENKKFVVLVGEGPDEGHERAWKGGSIAHRHAAIASHPPFVPGRSYDPVIAPTVGQSSQSSVDTSTQIVDHGGAAPCRSSFPPSQ
jgi:hypothetical protein